MVGPCDSFFIHTPQNVLPRIMSFVSELDALSAAVRSLSFQFSAILDRFGRDLFLIDGDALLSYVLEQTAGPSSDFALLPVIFSVEHALLRLTQLGAQYRLFFFGCNETLGWSGACEPACARRFPLAFTRSHPPAPPPPPFLYLFHITLLQLASWFPAPSPYASPHCVVPTPA